MKSIIIPLPKDVIDYLLTDGVQLPIGATKLSSCAPPDKDEDGWSSSSEEEGSCNSSTEDPPKKFHFPDINEQISNAIERLGGSALPKLNWSSPKDATWVNEGTLKCQTPGDVYILLKSSDFIMYDITHAMEETRVAVVEEPTKIQESYKTTTTTTNPSEFELVLRKWCNFYASMEFRCFVTHHQLVAISQRNHTQHYPHLKNDFMTLRFHINNFFEQYIRGRFNGGKISNYCFDCYVDKSDRVWLLDFNVWAERTDGLLFEWEELNKLSESQPLNATDENGNVNEDDSTIEIDNKNPEIRVVLSENEVHYDPLASYRAPIDTVDLAGDKNGANSFEEFMKMCEKPSKI